MQRLCDGVRHDLVGENLAVGHAHGPAELPGRCAEYTAELLHAVHERLVEQLRVEAQHEPAGIQRAQRAAQPGPGGLYGGAHLRLIVVRLFDAQQHVLK